MSDYDGRIDLRKVVNVESLDQSYAFTASAFCGPNAFFINADPAEVLAITHDVPGYKREPIGSHLAQYRFDRMLNQASQCPIVMPSIGIPFHSSEKDKLYDAALVRSMIEKGVQSMPFCLLGLDEQIEQFTGLCKSADKPVPLDEAYRPHIESKDIETVDLSGFTVAFHMEEMINSIDAHYDLHMSKHKMDNQKEFYSAFPLCRDMLDVLIATGCQYITPDRYWDGESILASMQEHIEKQQRQIGNDNPSAIELVDRFALLHERKIAKDKAATASYMGIIEQTGETALSRLTGHIAVKIAANSQAKELAESELSSSAKQYFQSYTQMHGHRLRSSGPDISGH